MSIGWVRVTVTVIDAAETVAVPVAPTWCEVPDRGGLGGCGVEPSFVGGAEVVDVDLLGAGACGGSASLRAALCAAMTLATVVGHAGDHDQRAGDDRDERGDAAAFVVSVHVAPLR